MHQENPGPPVAPPSTDPFDDEKAIEARLNHIGQVQNRTRATLGTVVVLSFAILFAAYSSHLSWNRHFAMQPGWYGGGSHVTERAHEYALRAWIENRFVTIPILGMRIPIDDIELLGAITMILFAYVYRHFVAQEHRAIAALLKDTKSCVPSTRRRVYYGISVHKLLYAGTFQLKKDSSLPAAMRYAGDGGPQLPRVSVAFAVLSFLPAAALVLLFLIDILVLFVINTPFRVPHDSSLWSKLDDTSRWFAGIYLAVSVGAAVVSWRFLKDVVAYEGVTFENLDKYGEELIQGKVIKEKLAT